MIAISLLIVIVIIIYVIESKTILLSTIMPCLTILWLREFHLGSLGSRVRPLMTIMFLVISSGMDTCIIHLAFPSVIKERIPRILRFFSLYILIKFKILFHFIRISYIFEIVNRPVRTPIFHFLEIIIQVLRVIIFHHLFILCSHSWNLILQS